MPKTAYHLDSKKRFIIDNYNDSPLFASFLPGIAGPQGIPLWAFYVSRGQGIVSFGVRNKDSAILEFLPADKAYQAVALRGFRTFLNITRAGQTVYHEPFQRNPGGGKSPSQRMIVGPHQMSVEEIHPSLGLKITAEMFTLPGASLAGLVRKLTVENISSKPLKIDFADGLPQLLPFGLNQYCIKNMSRTMEAFTVVETMKKNIPFLKLKVYPADSEKVVPVTAGNFFAGFLSSEGRFAPLAAVVDAKVIFGENADFTRPDRFLSRRSLNLKQQVAGNKNPSGFVAGRGTIAPRQSMAVYSLYGHAASLQELHHFIQDNITGVSFFDEKQAENERLISGITKRVLTVTSHDKLNEYTRQSFLDNLLRGGLSVQAPGGALLYLYGRKHGDLERDYNEFFLQDTHFSEGNGDFRDVAQNRRCELFFNPAVGDRNIRYFFSLIQPDGFNPLVLRNTRFLVQNLQILAEDKELADLFPELEGVVSLEFKFASLWSFLKSRFMEDEVCHDLAARILKHAEEVEDAEFEKGYWSDHWTYLLDLLENFAAVYPDRLGAVLLEDKSYAFFDPAHFVLPRRKKYILTDRGVRQYGAVSYNKEKDVLIKSRSFCRHRVRVQHGKGEIYRTHLLVKILTLAVNKLASLDPFCAGVEMESDRPGWCDALNGLPSLLGSALNETIELKRLMEFTLHSLHSMKRGEAVVSLPVELHEFLSALDGLLQEGRTDEKNPLRFWNESHNAKETYREKVFFGFDGAERDMTVKGIESFLERALAVLDRSVERGREKSTGRVFTYFINDAVAHQPIPESSNVEVTEFKQRPLPLFLEGFVHAMRVVKSPQGAKTLHERVQKTDLFDKKLRMYRLNAPLGEKSFELGRIAIFNYGWLENGSIFLHMHYKYVLEMVRRGLIEEFYKNINSLLIPYRDPREYGRSVTENVSFLVSSGYSINPEEHGRGFVARLSGSTVEYLHIWSHLLFGPAPFTLTADGELVFRLSPLLHKDLFLKKETRIAPFADAAETVLLPKNSLAFLFLGKTLVVYHNGKKKNTFGKDAAHVHKYVLEDLSGNTETLSAGSMTGKTASLIREGGVKVLHAHLA
ncbi:MAG: hypothetical protein HY548_08655 [Elusimicrobia bacterium]|nr:hypothetical protein [Elusimicrobiota bacterium]